MSTYDTDNEGDEDDTPLHDMDDVYSKLDDIETALKSITGPPVHSLSLMVFALFLWLVVPAFFSSIWYGKTRYVIQYGASYDQVTIGNEPHDCTFMRSPIGGKGCHYNREVSTVRVQANRWGGQSISYDEGKTWTQTATSTNGYPIVSRDDGKTWSTDDVPPHTEPGVFVSWVKEDDN